MLIECPECKREVSTRAEICVHCGNRLREIKPLPKSYDSTATTKNNSAAIVFSTIIGVILQIIGIIVFISFDNKYIDLSTKFGSDFYTYSYRATAYIAIALRWGITGILIGIGTILETHGSRLFVGKITTNEILNK